MKRTDSSLTAVLGPTNTGKTHFAVERLCGHSSGVMGFPLRLLAREVYDRVVALKGEREVGLLTGEERIMPPAARWILCTAESMPLDREVSFVALDEAQLAVDEERGHIFTDRILRARGREETLILGSESLRPMVRTLLPDAEIIGRPRFSQLSYAGGKKLTRLPPRSVIVAFSADQVYAVAEAMRRTRGGAAIVMGALSPRTRNAQVAMFQSGEVDYLVATDAVGMGLNLDVGHVAFASLTKFDGKRQRRLTISEIAQIAGRAGRHQRDGTFGVLSDGDAASGLTDAEIDRIENHRFPPIDHLKWRNSDFNFESIEALIASLEMAPDEPCLRPAPEAIDLAVLRAMASDPEIAAHVNHPALVSRLWTVCSLPDFRKLGTEHHARLVKSIFAYLGSGRGVIAQDWIAREVDRLDIVAGDVDTLMGRMAAIRTWAYVAHRADWLADPAHWAERTRVLEEKLSDALHRKLTERFVDRRTSVLMRALGDKGWRAVSVNEDGLVTVEDEPIGTLAGFRFLVDPTARSGERKRLLAAAEQFLPGELSRRAEALAQSPDTVFLLACETSAPIQLLWKGQAVATLKPGKDLLSPLVAVDDAIRHLPAAKRKAVEDRLSAWLARRIDQRLAALVRLASLASQPKTPPALRALLAQLAEAGGLSDRHGVDNALSSLAPGDRKKLLGLGLIVGTLDVFHPALLKPEAVRLRLALHAVKAGGAMPPLPMPGLGLLDKPAPALAAAAGRAGFRRFGSQMIRIDLVERVARAAHEARGADRDFVPDQKIATSLGIGTATYAQILRALGFHPVNKSESNQWRWSGRKRAKPTAAARKDGAFSALSTLRDRL